MNTTIKLPIPELKKALSVVGSVVPANPIVPALDNALFDIDGVSASLTTTDTTTIIRRTITTPEANPKVSFGLPYKLLQQFVSKVTAEEITITLTEESPISIVANLKAGKVTAKTPAEKKDAFPTVEIEQDVTFTDIDFADLQLMLEKCRHSISDDFITKINMTGINFQSSDGKLYAMSTDTHVGSMVNFDYPLDIRVNVAHDVVLARTLFPFEYVQVGFSEKRMVIKNADTEFQCRLIEEKFVPMLDMMNKFLVTESKKELTVNKADFLKELSMCEVFANEKDHTVIFNIEENKLVINVSDIGSNREYNSDLACEYSHEPFRIAVNAKLMKKMASTFAEEKLSMLLISFNNPILIHTEQHLAFIMPVQLPENA